jgi:acyl-CoA thioester hydrolase
MTSFNLPLRVYYEDTDAGGVMYHASYLRFAERGRTEFLRHIGYDIGTLQRDEGLLFVARHLEIDYLKPAMLDDALEVCTSIQIIKNSSFVMRQIFMRRDEKIAELHVTLVCVDKNTIKPLRLPDSLKSKFSNFLEKASA